jgi:endoglucanase
MSSSSKGSSNLHKSINPRIVGIVLTALYLVTLTSCGSDAEETLPTPLLEITDPGSGPGIGEARDISSFDLVAEMGVGWNLGNSMDVTSADKTFWGNPITSQAMIEEVRNMGFQTLRIPVTWGPNQENRDPYTIDEDYLEDVKRIVDFGFENEMHVIINVHHDDNWIIPSEADAPNAKLRLSSLWKQVANYFQIQNLRFF